MLRETKLRYSLSMPEPNTHYFDVQIEVPLIAGVPTKRSTQSARTLRLVMPVWTPGSYLVRDFSRNVLAFGAFDSKTGSTLRWSKESKNVWLVDSEMSEVILVKYKVYAFEFTVDTSYLDNRHAIINGASIFMYVEGLENESLILEVESYPQWKEISTGLEIKQKFEKSDRSVTVFDCPNFDILVDSPLELGNQSVYNFNVEGIEHLISIFSELDFNRERLAEDIQQIVKNAIPIFGEIPYQRYVFLIDIANVEGGGGLEHLNSTHCIAPFLRLEPPQEYRMLLSLFSHEFFHAWNVKRMRPYGLGPFNYSAETYTKSLWISEGITSYYDDLILRRGGIFSVAEYLDTFAVNVNQMTSLPGSNWESAEESSFDTWIKHYRPDANSPNVHSSYYVQGAVIGWMIDMEIRKATSSLKSLDDVMKSVYRQTYVNERRGFTDKEFEKACEAVAGTRSISQEIFESRVRGRKPVDFGKYLGYAGLVLRRKSEREIPKGFIGVKVRTDSGKTIVSSVLTKTPAESAGLSPGDEIIAVERVRVDNSKLAFLIGNRKAGDSVSILLSRDGSLHEANANLIQRPVFEYRIFKAESATDVQKRIFSRWLGASWESEIVYEDFTPSPTRKPLFDYI